MSVRYITIQLGNISPPKSAHRSLDTPLHGRCEMQKPHDQTFMFALATQQAHPEAIDANNVDAEGFRSNFSCRHRA